ncbi:peptide/nickel transport system ATP-binding protein [Cohaesibacter sp. ES.047]|uniref:ATP-binding cassette domain-containing protein n=1 Tax=Cohaesibacter sp. ES.047 TaxID=1798205 RepID=UPI000BB71DBE|nr:ATP-binding cassette domain-containing protein [Cohaesibacter sp. ES.047]SNY91997.1 peptide/nickel transport system ATP-binding protein [Cohaesibacter sp. ES.047]
MLSAEGLFHRFGDAVILDQASIAVEATARIGIAGPSGVGKTTLGRILAGQLRPQAGHVSWDGADIAALKGPSPVQLAPQSPELAVDPRWSIADVLENGGAIDDTILEGLGIRPEWHGRRARELSGGELARVSLARLILPTTRLLICDEITAQLDAISARQIWQALLAVLTERHIGLVVISHDDRLRKAVCTKSFQLQGGQLQPDVCFDRTEARDGASSSGGMAGRG